MAMKFTTDSLIERQAEVKAELKKVLEASGPKRAARDAFVQEHDAKRKAMNEELKVLEAPLAELHTEAAMIAKALGGKSLGVKQA